MPITLVEWLVLEQKKLYLSDCYCRAIIAAAVILHVRLA